MIVFPNAKINLGLFVTEKRNDGFHNLETVFYPINIVDVIEVLINEKTVDEVCFFNHGKKIDGDFSNNLIVKAIYLLKKDFDLPHLEVHLLKNIPFGAGLGGGSSDAAYTLKVLNEKFNLKLSTGDLQNYASQLGSDCAFFIENKPVFAHQKGDVFEPVNLSLNGYRLLLMTPSIHVSTAEAYAAIKPQKPGFDLRTLDKLPINEWKAIVKNDFEETVFSVYPELKSAKEKLYDFGAVFALMSGSGSSVYGIFEPDVLDRNLELINNFLKTVFSDFSSFVLDL